MKRRILGAIMLSTTLAIFLLGTPLALAIRHRYRDETVLELQKEVASIGERVISSTTEGLRDLKLEPSEATLTIGIYLNGRRIAGSGPLRGGDLVDRAGRSTGVARAGSDRIAVTQLVYTQDRNPVVVWASEALDISQDETERAWIAIAGAGAFALAAAAGAGRSLAKRLATPVAELRNSAVALGAGDFTARVQASGVPELDEAGSALAQTAERVQGLIERERTFSADASHQLRTPLTALRLSIETEMENPSNDRAWFLNGALVEVDRLEKTINGLLALARDAPMDRGLLDCEALIASTGDRYRGVLARSNRRLELERVGPLPSVRASEVAIAHALDVLIDNAVKHGAGPVTVRAKVATPGGVAIEVSDEGPGVQLSDEQLFSRRFSGPREGSHGIGLALARKLVQGEGGRLVLVRSRPKPLFEIFLPAVSEGAEAELSVPPRVSGRSA